MTDQQKQGAIGEVNAQKLASLDGEILIPVGVEENKRGTDFKNEKGNLIDVKTYGYILFLQYNKEKKWCSIPHPFNIESTSTHIYITYNNILKRFSKEEYFKQYFKDNVNIDSLRKLAKNYTGRCSEEEYLKRKDILEKLLKNFIKEEYKLDTKSNDTKWLKLKAIR